MSTLRITNIEAKADPSSPTVDEKIKLTNSNGDILVHVDGKTSGITTIGINTTAGNIKFDQNSNVVVTGIITATKFVGTIEPTSLEIGSNIKLGNAGVITATSYVGDGSALTGITGTTINNNADNRVITGSGTANTLEGEANLTYDGTDLVLNGSGDKALRWATGGTNKWSLYHNNSAGALVAYDNANNAERLSLDNSGNMGLGTNNVNNQSGYTSFTINNSTSGSILDLRRGDVALSGGRLVGFQNEFGLESRSQAAGSQISFYVNNAYSGRFTTSGLCFGNDTADANALDDYEEGNWTPNVGGTATYSTRMGRYQKVGNIVHAQFEITISSIGTGNAVVLSGWPYASANLGTVQTGVCSYYANSATNITWLALYIENNASTSQFVASDGTASAGVLNGPSIFGNSTVVFGAASYFMA